MLSKLLAVVKPFAEYFLVKTRKATAAAASAAGLVVVNAITNGGITQTTVAAALAAALVAFEAVFWTPKNVAVEPPAAE